MTRERNNSGTVICEQLVMDASVVPPVQISHKLFRIRKYPNQGGEAEADIPIAEETPNAA